MAVKDPETHKAVLSDDQMDMLKLIRHQNDSARIRNFAEKLKADGHPLANWATRLLDKNRPMPRDQFGHPYTLFTGVIPMKQFIQNQIHEDSYEANGEDTHEDRSASGKKSAATHRILNHLHGPIRPHWHIHNITKDYYNGLPGALAFGHLQTDQGLVPAAHLSVNHGGGKEARLVAPLTPEELENLKKEYPHASHYHGWAPTPKTASAPAAPKQLSQFDEWVSQLYRRS